MLRIAVDTNLINARSKDPAMNKLESLHAEGKLELITVSGVQRETANHPPSRAKAALRSFFMEPGVVGPTSVVGQMRVGSNKPIELRDVAALLFPTVAVRALKENNQWNDVTILLAAIDADVDAFITTDGNFHRMRDQIAMRFGLSVFTASDVVSSLDQLLVESPRLGAMAGEPGSSK